MLSSLDPRWILALFPGAALLLLVLWNHARSRPIPAVVVELNEVRLPFCGPVEVRFERVAERCPATLCIRGTVLLRTEVLALAEEALEDPHHLRVTVDGTPYESRHAWFEALTLTAGPGGALTAKLVLMARDPWIPTDAPPPSSSPAEEREVPPVTLPSGPGKGDLSA